MHRIDVSSASVSLPSTPAVGPKPNAYFTDGDPSGGTAATIPTGDWFNLIQEELCYLVTQAGLTLSKPTRTQVFSAVQSMIAASSSEPTAVGKEFWGTALPAGYVWANGNTLGNASSNGTNRANADTQALFNIFWENSTLQLFTSAGSTIARGASAAADFAANRAIAAIDKRERASIGVGTMGGTSTPGRVTSASTGGGNATTLGGTGGAETHSLTAGENGAHTHNITTHSAGGTVSQLVGGGGGSSSSQVSDSAGAGSAHNNMQPSIACNYIIKL